MTLEHPWWATRPRCEFCVHWTHDQDRRRPLLGTCDNKTLLLSGEVVKFRIQNDWCCDLYIRRIESLLWQLATHLERFVLMTDTSDPEN